MFYVNLFMFVLLEVFWWFFLNCFNDWKKVFWFIRKFEKKKVDNECLVLFFRLDNVYYGRFDVWLKCEKLCIKIVKKREDGL